MIIKKAKKKEDVANEDKSNILIRKNFRYYYREILLINAYK